MEFYVMIIMINLMMVVASYHMRFAFGFYTNLIAALLWAGKIVLT
jgi:hypothetical protein